MSNHGHDSKTGFGHNMTLDSRKKVTPYSMLHKTKTDTNLNASQNSIKSLKSDQKQNGSQKSLVKNEDNLNISDMISFKKTQKVGPVPVKLLPDHMSEEGDNTIRRTDDRDYVTNPKIPRNPSRQKSKQSGAI